MANHLKGLFNIVTPLVISSNSRRNGELILGVTIRVITSYCNTRLIAQVGSLNDSMVGIHLDVTIELFKELTDLIISLRILLSFRHLTEQVNGKKVIFPRIVIPGRDNFFSFLSENVFSSSELLVSNNDSIYNSFLLDIILIYSLKVQCPLL